MQNLNSLCFCNWRPPWICLRLLPAAGMHYLKFIPNLCEKNKKNTSCLVPDGLVWIGYYTCRSTDRVSGLLESRGLSGRSQVKSTAEQRPVRVNNAEQIYFPPIFQQENASCTAAARIAYMFTYEMNAARRLDASVEKNQYPTHYNWLHYYQNTDYPSVLKDHGVPDAVTYGGRTFSKDFGPDQNWYSNDYGWMQGYDKWYAAMFNRIERSAMFPVNVGTEEGREAVKQWLWNHQGNSAFDAGGVCTIEIGFVQGYSTSLVPETETNRALGVVGDGYVKSWGVQIAFLWGD